MKRSLSLLILLTMLIGTLSFVSCGDPEAPDGTVTRVTLEFDPSVEIMLSEDSKVISVTALNDDAAVLLIGESFDGKSVEDSIATILSLAAQTGYLAGKATVGISVSGDSEYAKTLSKKLIARANGTLSELGMSSTAAEMIESLNIDALRALAARSSLSTDAQLAKMNENQLNKAIADGRLETTFIITKELREAYLVAKEYRVSLAGYEAIDKIIEELGGAYLVTHEAYNVEITAYSDAIDALAAFRYDTLISPESEYQKKLSALRDQMTDLLSKRAALAALSEGSSEYESASAELKSAEDAYSAASAELKALAEAADATMNEHVATIESLAENIRETEKKIFNDVIESSIVDRVFDIEASLFEARTAFFAEFDLFYGEAKDSIEAALLAKKTELTASSK